MFIVAPTRGGYRGDVVNSGFRQGRQDAFRDYIDNFNFALKADSANNAENQKQVQRIAGNYGLQNAMRQDARNEALNFVNDSTKIDDAVLGNQISFVKNAELRNPETIEQLGQSQATQVRATQNANENTAAYKANKAQTMVEQQPLEAQVRETTLNKQQAQGEFDRTKTFMGMDATRFLADYGTKNGYETYIDRAVENRANEMVEAARQRGEVLDPVEAKRLVNEDHDFIRNTYGEYQNAIAQAKNSLALSKGYTTDENGNIVAINRTQRQSTANQTPQPKAYKMGESFAQFAANTPGELINNNVMRSGNTLYFANGQMITFPNGTDMDEVIQKYKNSGTIGDTDNANNL